MRRDLAELLRNINIIATTDEEDVMLMLLSKAKINIEKNDIIANGTLDDLIRSSKITNEMATSLMNDSVYAYNISKNLISMANVIFIDSNTNIEYIGEDMVISDEDVELILQKG